MKAFAAEAGLEEVEIVKDDDPLRRRTTGLLEKKWTSVVAVAEEDDGVGSDSGDVEGRVGK